VEPTARAVAGVLMTTGPTWRSADRTVSLHYCFVSQFGSISNFGKHIFVQYVLTTLGLTKPRIKWNSEGEDLGGVKLTTTSRAEVKNKWSCTSTPPYSFSTSCLIKYREGQLYFTAGVSRIL